jgi:hypothetical protein
VFGGLNDPNDYFLCKFTSHVSQNLTEIRAKTCSNIDNGCFCTENGNKVNIVTKQK